MSFHYTGSKLVSDTVSQEYTIDPEFERVLKTTQTQPIPDALVTLGILTETVQPLEGNQEKQIRTAETQIDDIEPVTVPDETVAGVKWLLARVRETLDSQRKQKIGELLNRTGLNGAPPEPSVTKSKMNQQRSTEESIAATPDTETNSENKESTPFECEFCGRGFQSKGELISHAVHCGERPESASFTCEYCGNKYVSTQALEDHLKRCDAAESSNTRSADDSGTESDKSDISSSTSSRGSTRTSGSADNQSHLRVDRVKDVEGRVVEYNEDGGYGFVYTADLLDYLVGSPSSSSDVFIHITEVQTTHLNEGDRLQFDVVEEEDGFAGRQAEIIERNADRGVDGEIEDDKSSRLGFGHEVDDTRWGLGRKTGSDQDIEDFSDDRKFR